MSTGAGHRELLDTRMRIVSICPSNTEIACVLGLADSLVGLDRSSDFPPEIVDLPRVGPDLAVDVPAIAALKPDLVLSSLSVPGMEKNLDGLDAAGLPHVVLDASSIAEVYASIRLVGRLVGRGARAAEVVAGLEARMEAVRARGAALPKRARVFLEWWPKPVITPGRRCWTTELIDVAGGTNVFADLDVRSTPLETHAVIERAPDLLFTCWCGVPHDHQKPEKMGIREGWDAIPGVVTGELHAAPERYFGRPGPRLVEGAEWMHAHLARWAASA